MRKAPIVAVILTVAGLASASLAGEPEAHPPAIYACLYQEAASVVGAGMDHNPRWAIDHFEDERAIGAEIWCRCAREHPDEARVVDHKAAEILAGLALTDGIARMAGEKDAPPPPDLDVYVAISLYHDCVERNAVGYAVTTNDPAETVFKAAAASCMVEVARLIEAYANHGEHMTAEDITSLSRSLEGDVIKSILDARLAARSGEGAPVRSDHAGHSEPRL
jgi:hypothetical protein